jgi:cell division protein FtsA
MSDFTRNEDISVGLDIGSSKICLIIASKDKKTNEIKILGIGITNCDGLSRGVITNIEKTSNSIQEVVRQAEQQSGIKVKEVIIGFAADHIISQIQKGIISITNPNREITKEDVNRLVEDTKKYQLPADRRIIESIPQSFILDNQNEIYDPVGMSGVRLESNVMIITSLSSPLENLEKAVERANLKVKDIVLSPIAAAESTLIKEEKDLGVALIDIGAGTTDIAIYSDSILRYVSSFGVAGRSITDDIRKVLQVLQKDAENIKKQYGYIHTDKDTEDRKITLPGIGGRPPKEFSKLFLSQIITARAEEICQFILLELKKSNYYDKLGEGVVITGGTSLLNGFDELLSNVLRLPVKIGIPSGISIYGLSQEIQNPIYSVSVGLALMGFKKYNNGNKIQNIETNKNPKMVFSDDEKYTNNKENIEETEKEDKKKEDKKSGFDNFIDKLKTTLTNL